MPHKGVCVGGPMAGLTIETRSDCGFLAVDRPAGAAWVYRTDPDNGRFVLCTEPDPSSIDAEGTRALDLDRAVAEQDLDVIALPDAEPGSDEEPAEADLFAGVPPEPVLTIGDPAEGQD